ncbi:LLM class flavin-dependent oxidoreductase [Natrinema caseinilyticum]|uniref:LLM class flavin-dependent oxidoreductase n=1 Tax=Natrinema caseinilyticum TaxID=2961570 RepID=UPI0020C4ADFB|nr:LLM class flavin-dependent oxidoreductase [Natrinema caseinilyticum]
MTGENRPFEYPRTGFVLPSDRPGTDLLNLAVNAVESGFDSVWTAGGWGYDPLVLLARVAERVDCALGTCVVNGFSRTPSALAAGSLALHEATDGRFVLGIGASTPAVVEGFHGQLFDRPLRRLRETIEILNLALSGDTIDYDGEVFQLNGFTLDRADGAAIPVFNGALGRTNLAMTIDHADGWISHLLPLPTLESALADARKRASTDGSPRICPSIPTAISEDPTEARQLLAEHVATYVGSTAFYRDVIAEHGFHEEAHEIHDAWQDGQRSVAVSAVTRPLLDAIGIAGRPRYGRERLLEILETVDTALISFPRGATSDVHRAVVEALPPATR